MSFNVLEYFDKRIPRNVLGYASEKNCPRDCIVKFKPTPESEPYYALCDIGSGKEWVEVIRQRMNEITIAYAYPIQTSGQRIAVGARYNTALELPIVPVIPGELPLIHNFKFHHQSLRDWLLTMSEVEDKSGDLDFESIFVDYMMKQDEFELSGFAMDSERYPCSFKIVIEKNPENNTYHAEMVLDESWFRIDKQRLTEELGHLDNTFFEKLYQFCLGYGKACLEDPSHSIKDIEDLVKQKCPFHDILNYFNK